MSSLLIRNVDDALKNRLKAKAKQNRRSLEEEARERLRHSLAVEPVSTKPESMLDIVDEIFGECGFDLEIPPRSADLERPPPDFSGPEYDR